MFKNLYSTCQSLLQTSLRATHTRSRTSKQKFNRRQLTEAVPNIYKFQKVVDPKMSYIFKLGHGQGKDRKRGAQRYARFYRQIHEDTARKEMSGDMGLYTDNVRD